MIIDGYYQAFYDYPRTVDDLISFIDVCEFSENFDTTIEKLKNNRDEIILNDKKNTLVISLGNRVIYETALRSPCDELSYNRGFYLGRVLFFDAKGLSVASDEITSEFKNGLKERKMRYDRTEKDGDINKYVILKFVQSEGLTPFCDGSIPLKDYEYFQVVEEYLIVFSEKHHLNRIIFTTPIFYR
ncbi:MAG: hypothetical protein U1C46_05270 [Bacteroidales bacterium]|nr:hypothetical protein [Bacteroidales bacterium]